MRAPVRSGRYNIQADVLALQVHNLGREPVTERRIRQMLASSVRVKQWEVWWQVVPDRFKAD